MVSCIFLLLAKYTMNEEEVHETYLLVVWLMNNPEKNGLTYKKIIIKNQFRHKIINVIHNYLISRRSRPVPKAL